MSTVGNSDTDFILSAPFTLRNQVGVFCYTVNLAVSSASAKAYDGQAAGIAQLRGEKVSAQRFRLRVIEATR